MEIVPCRNGCSSQWAAQSTTAIARMLGKAVKLRHCPATVSAPAQRPVLSARAGNQPGIFRRRGGPSSTTAASPLGAPVGRWLEEAQVRRPVLAPSTRLRSEGNEGAFMPDSAQSSSFSLLTRALPRAFALLLLRCLRRSLPGCLHPRRGHRHLRRQGHRRQRGSDQRRQGRRSPSPRPTAAFRFSPASRAASS
jgi:hypothetical protein